MVVDTFGWIACSIVIFFFFTLWLFSYNNIDEPLKDAWSISATVFAALTALGATIIAAYLFNDWRHQHNKTVEKEMAWIAIQKFDIADLHLSQFQDAFENFKYRCNFISEMPDEEFKNLDTELNRILKSISAVSLDFASFLESVRKYSHVAENTYFDDIKEQVWQINSIIFNTQNHRAHFPGSMNAIMDSINVLKAHTRDVDEKCINKMLSELKALT